MGGVDSFVLALSSVSLRTVQFYYKFSELSLKYRLMFNQLIQSHLANYLSSEKIHLLFCSNLFEPPLHLVTMTMHLLLCVLGKTPQIRDVKPLTTKSTRQSIIKTFLKPMRKRKAIPKRLFHYKKVT